MATGLGWLMLLDLSANGNFSNRYLALYHQGHLWLGCWRSPWSRSCASRSAGRSTSHVSFSGARGRVRRRIGSMPATVGRCRHDAGVVALVGALLANMPQLTSELGRAWLIVGAAWFFFLRGDPLAERLAAAGLRSLRSRATSLPTGLRRRC